MNSSTRVLLVSLLSVAALVGCSSNKTKQPNATDVTPPTVERTEQVRDICAAGRVNPTDKHRAIYRDRYTVFDRWLRGVLADAWDEGYADYLEGPAEMTNPYREENR